jgi:predicted ATPase/transcriptional regulator with XRE-family HTH domain
LTEVSFGQWLKRQRNGRGLTQEQLAHQIGCAAITLRKIEAEERRPSVQIIERLAEIFNIPPNEQKRFLRYARGELKYAMQDRIEETPWQATASTRTNLPAGVTALIGRESELIEIRAYLMRAEVRLVTLIGPPGIGKTRLGIEAAGQSLSDFPDGVFFVALAPLDDPSLIAFTTLQALGYVESKKLPADKQLLEGIGDKRMLIVLDNCEHLVQEAATFAAGFLSACPRLKIITTSRESLHILGEWLYTVPPLELPDRNSPMDVESAAQYPALTLFTERARAVQSDFALTAENIKTVSTICAQLDGLPLVIELIAAQLRLLSPQSLLERLNDRFILSAEGMRNASARQISLSQAIGWSYDSLTPDEQKLFAYLSVFSRRFTLPVAESIFSRHFAVKSVSDLIASLLDKSLLQRSSDSRSEVRLTMLVTIHHFALERLRQMSEEIEIRNSHLAYFLDLAGQTDKEIHGPNQLEWINRAENELDNFRAAIGWALESQDADAGLRIASKLSFFCIVRGYLRDGIGWLEKTLAQSRGASAASKAEALRWLGGMLGFDSRDDYDRSSLLLEESLILYRELEDRKGIAWALNSLGINALNRNEYAKATKLLGESLALRQELGDPWSIAQTLGNFASLAMQQGDYVNAKKYSEESLALFQRAGDPRGIARQLMELGDFARRKGDFVRATTLLTQALSQLWQIRDQWSLTFVLDNLASLANAQGNPERSARLFGAAEYLREAIGMPLQALDRAEYEQNVGSVRKNLDEMTFAKAWAEGRIMTLEQVFAYALENHGG